MTKPTVSDSLHAVVIALRDGAFNGQDLANEVEQSMYAVQRNDISIRRAKGQISILADMLDDGLTPIDEGRAKYIAAQIRKYLEWMS